MRKTVYKISSGNTQVNAHFFENTKKVLEVLNTHITLWMHNFGKCKAVAAAPSQMTQQLGCVWPLPWLDKLWEEESSSGDASVERRVSILSWYKDSFRVAVGDIASPLLHVFLKALSCSTYTHTSEMLISLLCLTVWGKWEVLFPNVFKLLRRVYQEMWCTSFSAAESAS